MLQEATDILKSDSIHLRLDVLWKSLKRMDYKSASIHMDVDTFRELRSSRMAFQNMSLDIESREAKWRKIGIVFHKAAIPFLVGSEAIPETPEREPFCLYIEVRKQNERVVYLDDPQTDKHFL